MEYFARVFKVNPYHDAHGRFTSKEKVGHYAKKVKMGLQHLSNLAASGLNPAQAKSMIESVASDYVKQGLHYAAATSGSGMPGTIESLANLHGLSPEVTKKLKGVIAAKKAWTSQYKNKALAELQSDEMAQMAAESILNYSDKANAKYNQKTDALQTQFYANGGSKKDWEKAAEVLQGKLLEKLANPEKTLATTQNPPAPTPAKPAASPPPPPVDLGSTLTPKTAPTGFGALPPKPHDWHTWGPGKKAAWTKKNNQLAAMSAYAPQPTPTPVSSATVLTPKPAPAFDASKLTTKWSEPDSINDAKKLNAEIGTAYYMKRQTLGKDHPEVQALYSEWEKSKQYLQNYGGLSKHDIGALSSQQKSDAEQHMAANKQKDDLMKSQLLNVMTLHSKTGTAFNSLKLMKQKAAAHGMSESEIENLQEQADQAVIAEKKAAKAALPGKIEAAAYAQAQAKLGGLPHDQAKKSLELLKAEGAQSGLSYEDIQSLLSKGAAKAVVDKQKQEQLAAALGGKVTDVISHYDKNFKTLPGIAEMHQFSSSTKTYGTPEQKAYFKHHEDQYNLMTQTEKNVLESFLGSGYKSMNKGVAQDKTEVATKSLSKMTLGADITTRRNMAQKWFWESFGLKHWESGLSDADIQSVIGKTYKEKSVMSTTKDLASSFTMSNVAQTSGTASIVIRAHKEIRGIDATIATGSSKSENEVTMAPGLTLLVRKVHKGGPPGGDGSTNVKYTIYADAIYTDNPHAK